jgi:hypothetical protein
MLWVPGGAFLMGSDNHYPEEAPAHRVTVSGFWMDRTTVPNREFARFVAETGHVTLAEQVPDPADYPYAKPELLVPASSVFRQPAQRVDLGEETPPDRCGARPERHSWAARTLVRAMFPICPAADGPPCRAMASRNSRSLSEMSDSADSTTTNVFRL